MENINILNIIGRHCPLLAASLEHKETYSNVVAEHVVAAIKEIVEAVIDQCSNKATTKLEQMGGGIVSSWEEVDKASILAVKQQIKYD